MRTIGILCSFCLIAGFGTIRTSHIVTIDDGQLKGVKDRSLDGSEFYQFLGIPYARPPVNELRFHPPQPNEPWIGIKNATKAGDSCLSRHSFTNEVIGSEDCLYLNVYTKHLPNASISLRPVMVFIYGGGLISGSGSPQIYGPEFLMMKNIVLVAFNYRLGVLGFLSFDDPELAVPGNMGLKDQVLALKWVQKNIGSFNGDPGNVTIFGNSAGAACVHAHILSPASKGLFNKAMLQSGSALNSWFWGSKNNALELVARAGQNVSNQSEALGILKKLSARRIFAAYEKMHDSPLPSERRQFSAVVEIPNDTAFLQQNPVKILKSASFTQVPIIIGYVEDEGMLLEHLGGHILDLDIATIMPVALNISQRNPARKLQIIEEISRIYPKGISKSGFEPMSDTLFLNGIFQSIRLLMKHAQEPIYLYRISIASQLNQLKILLNKTHDPGVGHSDELGYLFNTSITPPIAPNSLEDRYIRIFVQLWTNFALYGNPTPSDDFQVIWTPVKRTAQLEVLDIGPKLEMKPDIPERSPMDSWQRIFEKYSCDKYV